MMPIQLCEEDFLNKSFFLFGALAVESSGVVTWKGSLLEYIKTRPTAEQLQRSRSFFESSGPESSEVAGGATSGIRPVSGIFKGSYMFDARTDREIKFSDTFELDFREIQGSVPTQYTVVGVGTSNLGVFVMDGAYDSSSHALAVSKLYVKRSDPLGMLSIRDIQQYHGRQLSTIHSESIAAVDPVGVPPTTSVQVANIVPSMQSTSTSAVAINGMDVALV